MFSAAALFGIVLLTTACKKESDPQFKPAEPANSAEVNMAATYYDATPAQGLTYLAFSPSANQYSDRLELYFRDSFNRDQLRFVLPKSRQKPGLVGTYTLATQPDPGQGDIRFEYTRPFNENTSNFFSSNNNQLPGGTLIITGYDASRKLLSGTFTFTIKKAKDPFRFTPVVPGSPQDSRADADVKIYGNFSELTVL